MRREGLWTGGTFHRQNVITARSAGSVACVTSEGGPAESPADTPAGDPPRRAAAFFDLDKTVIAKSSTLAMGGPLYRGGLIGRRAVLSGSYAQVVRIERGSEQHVEASFHFKGSSPLLHPGGNLLVRAAVMVERSLEQQLGLMLGLHLIEPLDLVVRQDASRCRFRIAKQAEQTGDLLPRRARSS